jgi:hypothetical protein
VAATSPVFVKFVSRWMREEFYACYLHCVKGKALIVSMLLRLCKDNNRRIYVSEHLALHDSTIFREAKRLNLFSRVFTRKDVVSVILLNGANRSGRVVTFECWCLMKFFFSISYFDLVLSFFHVYMRIFGLFT